MAKAKIAITLDEASLGRVDKLVRQSFFASRSQAIQEAIEEKLARLERSRLARETAKLDPAFEKALAEEGLSEDIPVVLQSQGREGKGQFKVRNL